MRTDLAEKAIDSVTSDAVRAYKRYWADLAPRNDDDVYRRWLFAYASVNSGVAANLYLYEYLDRLPRVFHDRMDAVTLAERLRSSRGGMHTVRGKAIWWLNERFWWADGPSWWGRKAGEPWAACRKRIAASAFGLGPAKTAFGLELIDPLRCRAVCLDRHMLRLYGLDTGSYKESEYDQAESHWVRYCGRRGYPPAIARHVWWDRRRTPAQTSTRYWSYVFEKGR